VPSFRLSAIKVEKGKFDYQGLIRTVINSATQSLKINGVRALQNLEIEFKKELNNLPDIKYYVSPDKRIRIRMSELTKHLYFTAGDRSAAIVYDREIIKSGDIEIPIAEIVKILEYGSASHHYPASAIYLKLKSKYTQKFGQVLLTALDRSFDQTVAYSKSKFGKETTKIDADFRPKWQQIVRNFFAKSKKT